MAKHRHFANEVAEELKQHLPQARYSYEVDFVNHMDERCSAASNGLYLRVRDYAGRHAGAFMPASEIGPMDAAECAAYLSVMALSALEAKE